MIENTFGINIVPENDAERIKALQRYRIMDTPSEDSFDRIAKLATQIFKVPISLVSLVDADKVFFKANVGMGKIKDSNRGRSLCALAVLTPDVTVFEDALKEPCLIANPNVIGDFGLRFYAGAPLITHDGYMIGTLCIIDQVTRLFTKDEEIILKGLAGAIMDHIELRLSALDERDKLLGSYEDLVSQQEETFAINEELTATNEELSESQNHLTVVNERLTKSEELFRLLVEQSPVAMGKLKGRDLIIDIANNKVLDIWGKDYSVIGKPLNLALPEIEGQPFLQILDDVFTSGQPFIGQEVKTTLTENGRSKEVFLNFVYQPIKGEDGFTRSILFVANDITEQVNARNQIEYNAKIDDQRKNDFIGMVSHELKTPLTSLNGFIQMLQLKAKKLEDGHTTTVLDKAQNQVLKMTKMINGFLNVSRFESGKMYLDHERFDMKDLIKEIEEETVPANTSHKIIFEPVLTTWVKGDRDKLGQVITNLISNALKYSATGTTVQIACFTANNCSHVKIRDEGMGISKKDIDKLFDRYYRVDGHQMKGIAGFGIGLYLCSEIITRHNGKIGLESEVGKGSTFFFSIPVID